jgi:single-stranded DNA-binding protein
MQFLDSKMSDSSSNTEYSATAAAPQSNPAPTAPAEANAAPQGDDYIKDDIPF